MAVFEHARLLQRSAVHASPSLHAASLAQQRAIAVPVQRPPWHESGPVQASPSEQATPSAGADWQPRFGLHVSVVQGSPSSHETCLWSHEPFARRVSEVHKLPSSQTLGGHVDLHLPSTSPCLRCAEIADCATEIVCALWQISTFLLLESFLVRAAALSPTI
jgi:hypothetical protein